MVSRDYRNKLNSPREFSGKKEGKHLFASGVTICSWWAENLGDDLLRLFGGAG